ncbi:MAG: ABC transporter ATP-binding protein, partial [Mariprofundales bacterium]
MTIRIENLEKRYASEMPLVLKGINMHIKSGEFFGLLGPNGSGKTTLISILTGVLSSSKGKVFICDDLLEDSSSEFKQNIGLAPQEAALYSSLSLKENLVFFGSMYGLKGSELKEKINFCINVVQLSNHLNQPIASFSGGMRQRANIAVSIINKPQILFLDEPTVGVDPQSRNMIFECLREFNANGVTIIYTTHYMEEAEELCSNIGILDHGSIIAQGSAQALIAEHGCKNL